MNQLELIEKQTKEFADKRQKLSDGVQELQDKIEALKRELLPNIKAAAEDVAACQAALHETIEGNKAMFKKPKTMVIAGIRIGFKKQKGAISFESEEMVIKLIKKYFPDQEELLINTTEKVLKKGVEQLSGAELKKLGVKIADDSDEVMIKPIGDDIDKFVTALLEEGEQILKEAS